MTNVTEEKAREEIKRESKKITEDDIDKVIKKHEELEDKFKNKKPLEKFAEDIKWFFSLIKDYTNKEYKDVPWGSVAAIAVALLYVINPFDLVPDFIPVVGYVDDATVIFACLNLVGKDLEKYKEWKSKQA